MFDPGTGSQVHDFNGGIVPETGLFWTVQLPDDALQVHGGGRRATLKAEHVPVLDTFQILAPTVVPAEVSFTVTWQAKGSVRRLGSGSAVDPTDPAAFFGRFWDADATGTITGSEIGFSFSSDPG